MTFMRDQRLLASIAALCLLCGTSAHADRPANAGNGNGNGGGNGGGGSGGGDKEPALFNVIELPGFGDATAITNPTEGIVVVAGSGPELADGLTFSSAMVAVVDTSSRDVLTSEFLPEPTDDAPHDTGSGARAINPAGIIVGSADVYDEDEGQPPFNSRRFMPVRWLPGEDGYVCEVLPVLDGDNRGSVFGINDSGEMVGMSVFETTVRAVYWTPAGEPVDLNAKLPDDSPWTLLAAIDINAAGTVVGAGVLDGVVRGFTWNLDTADVVTVPLVPGWSTGDATQINENGHLIGRLGPNSESSYFWAGPGTDPIPLAAGDAGGAAAINELSEMVGGATLSGESSMTLWQPNNGGQFNATDLGSQIDNKPRTWALRIGFAINDDLWIAGYAEKYIKGKASGRFGVLVIPNL